MGTALKMPTMKHNQQILIHWSDSCWLYRASRIQLPSAHGQWFFDSGRKEGNVLFNDALNTFYLRSYGIRHVVKYHTYSERENLLQPHGLRFPINSKGSFISIIPQTGALAGMRNSSMGPPHEGSIQRPIAPWANALTTELHLTPTFWLWKPNNLKITVEFTEWPVNFQICYVMESKIWKIF